VTFPALVSGFGFAERVCTKHVLRLDRRKSVSPTQVANSIRVGGTRNKSVTLLPSYSRKRLDGQLGSGSGEGPEHEPKASVVVGGAAANVQSRAVDSGNLSLLKMPSALEFLKLQIFAVSVFRPCSTLY
jgi:hypothetical protein